MKWIISLFNIRNSFSEGFYRSRYADVCRLLLPLLIPLILANCQSVPGLETQTGENLKPVNVESARLSLFLNLKTPNGPSIRYETSSLEVLVDHAWLPLAVEPPVLDSEKIGAGQLYLGGQWVAPGTYEGIRFSVTQSSLRRGMENYEVISSTPYVVELKLPSPRQLAKDESLSLFLAWDVERSLENSDNLGPVMTISPPFRQFLRDLVYVACPDIDTIFVIRCDKNWVADSFGITGKPTYIALDQTPAKQILYVLTSRESRIKVVELSSQRIIDSFSIPLVNNPGFMTISPDGQSAYVIDENTNYLSRLDLTTGTLTGRVRLGYQPQYATYLVGRDLLAVASVISQNVSFLDPLNLTEVASIPAGDSPDGMVVTGNRLYIAESGANTVSIMDIPTFTIQARISVGFTPRRLLTIDRQIYVSNYNNGSISVIYPGQLGVGREISGLTKPLEMVYDESFRWIYVGDEQKKGLAIIDYATNQLSGYITLGARPLGMAVIQ